MNLYGYDTETWLMGVGNVIPPIVCAQVYDMQSEANYLVSTGDGEELRQLMVGLFQEVDEDPEALLVAHNASYDLAIAATTFPELVPVIWRLLYDGKVKDTLIREKLLNLTDHGNLEFYEYKGFNKRLLFDMASVVKKRFGVDLSADKDKDDAWRKNYKLLDGIPVSDWPKEAVDYAKDDPVWTLKIFLDQEEDAVTLQEDAEIDPFVTESFRVAADFSLFLATSYGAEVDGETIGQVSEEVFAALIPEKLPLLFDSGIWEEFDPERLGVIGVDPKSTKLPIVQKAVPPRPHKRGTKEHLPSCEGHKDHPDYKKGKKVECSCPPKMSKAKPEKCNKNALKDFVMALADSNDAVTLKYGELTDNMREEGRTQGNISVDGDWVAENRGFHDVLMQYSQRQELQKLVTDYLPNLRRAEENGGVIHAPFDVLKRTGRTSSSGGGKAHPKPYPAWNGQQVDPRVRKCIVPRPGYIFYSLDWKAMELCTAAQTCLDLFGHSVLADKINEGLDTHSYLGSQIAYHLDDGFRSICSTSDPDDTFEVLWEMRNSKEICDFPWARHKNEELAMEGKEEQEFTMKDFYKHFRKFAKPTGLGYPGGLGPKTFLAFARGTYGVDVDMQTAKELRKIWLETYPEFVDYFQWINRDAIDFRNGQREVTDKKTGKIKKQNKYFYETPLGMRRSGCDYCAACNGNGMQSPGAEGALMAMIDVTRATHDPEYGYPDLCWDEKGFISKPSIFIHDEIFGELRDEGPEANTRRINEQCRIMEEAFKNTATPDVKSVVEPALMRRCWIKFAEDSYNNAGNLIPWDDDPKNLELALEKKWVPEHLA